MELKIAQLNQEFECMLKDAFSHWAVVNVHDFRKKVIGRGFDDMQMYHDAIDLDLCNQLKYAVLTRKNHIFGPDLGYDFSAFDQEHYSDIVDTLDKRIEEFCTDMHNYITDFEIVEKRK